MGNFSVQAERQDDKALQKSMLSFASGTFPKSLLWTTLLLHMEQSNTITTPFLAPNCGVRAMMKVSYP